MKCHGIQSVFVTGAALATMLVLSAQAAFAALPDGALPAEIDPSMTPPELQAFLKERIHTHELDSAPAMKVTCAFPEGNTLSLTSDISDEDAMKALDSVSEGFGTVVMETAKLIRSRPSFVDCGLRDAEIAAINLYTLTGYITVNAALSSGKPAEKAKVETYVRLLNGALFRLAPYYDYVARGTDIPETTMKKYEVGNRIKQWGYTSTSRGYGFGGSSRMIILSKSCRYIAPFSNYPGEDEVLCTPGMELTLHYKEQINGINYFLLEEFNDYEH